MPSFTSFFLSLSLFLIVYHVQSNAAADAVSGCYTSFFSFGDSLIDTGNYMHIDKSNSIARSPYGMTFFHQATGRCTDGRVLVDFIAEALGLPLLPPYLPSRSNSAKLRHGANFAVAGATALAAEYFVEHKIEGLLTNASLRIQIEWFLQLLPSLCNSSSGCRKYLKETLFLVGEIGANDYYRSSRSAGRSIEEIRTLVPQVVRNIKSAVETLIKHGARTLVVPGNLPMGCLPSVLTIKQSSNKDDYEAQTGCLKTWNNLTQYHNHLVKIQVDRLQKMYPYVTIIYSDYYNAAWQVFPSPKQYGFSKGALTACCGVGGRYHYSYSSPCGTNGAKACSDPSQYWQWDGAHPTEGGHRLIADAVINKLPAAPCNRPVFISFGAALMSYLRQAAWLLTSMQYQLNRWLVALAIFLFGLAALFHYARMVFLRQEDRKETGTREGGGEGEERSETEGEPHRESGKEGTSHKARLIDD